MIRVYANTATANVAAMSSEPGPRKSPSPESGQVLADARDSLRDVLDWRLPSTAWNEVAGIIAEMVNALAGGDLASVDAATVRLDLASPYRVIRVGDQIEGEEPTPRPVREQANHLIHTLEEELERPEAADGPPSSRR